MRGIYASALVCVLGCSSAPEPAASAERVEARRAFESDRVARVADVEISRADVERVMRATGLDAREALTRLENEVLLAREAARRGLASDGPVRTSEARVAVQRLLELEVEATVTPASIAERDVAEVYEQRRRVYDHPQLRASVHVLARVGPDENAARTQEAERFIEHVINEMRTEGALAVQQRYASSPPVLPFEIRAEQVPAMESSDAAAPEYLRAVFSMADPGVFPRPVRTSFGLHAIALVEIVPEAHRSLGEVSPELRAEMVVPLRERRLAEIIARLEQATPPVLDEAHIAAALARDPNEMAP
ncbi:MAG: hypothetical protein IPK60_24875 [Sandaracinaceae bacterium]|nr:hypothetical protein [Sandaracinaceae bacterium]